MVLVIDENGYYRPMAMDRLSDPQAATIEQ